jgi:glyoxylase-like metal-dependent hydrolase (beta-lactamase superfamily II)
VVEVLCEGWLVREAGEVAAASSTVTLVGTDAGPVLVDTGSRDRSADLLSAMSRAGVRPGHVRHVVNTHLHMDHCGSNDLFPNAVFHAHALEDPPAGCRRVAGETRLAGGVRLVPTPGHTRGSLSVFVESDRRYAVCGDAIPTRANYESRVPPAKHFDRALAVRSMDMVLAWAETVVPGHDRPFEVVQKK